MSAKRRKLFCIILSDDFIVVALSLCTAIKRRRSTGSGTLARQGVFVNEPPTNNSTTKLRLNGDGSLGQIKTSAPKITSFFKSGAPSFNKLVVPEVSSRKASISNYFTSKKASINIPVRVSFIYEVNFI